MDSTRRAGAAQLHAALERQARHAFDAFELMLTSWKARPAPAGYGDPGVWFRELHLALTFTSPAAAARARQLLARHDASARRKAATVTARIPYALACAVVAAVGLRFRTIGRERQAGRRAGQEGRAVR